MAQIKKAMILAAGLGTRLGELTKHTPKPLIDIAGSCPLIRSLNLLEQVGIEEVAINIHHFADVIRDEIAKHKTSIKITFFYEENLLETGGAIKNASSFFNNEAFLLINGDVIWQEEDCKLLEPLLNNFNPIEMDSLLALIPTNTTTEFRGNKGDFSLDNNNYITIPNDKTEAMYVFAGIQVIHPRIIENSKETKFGLYPYFVKAVENKRLKGMVYNAKWVDIGTPEGLIVARNMLSKNIKIAI